jgi:hypothetical protein
MKRILSIAETKADIWHSDADGNEMIETRYDTAPLLHETRIDRDLGLGADRKATFRKIANIPEHVMDQAFREGWFHDPAAWKKWVNNPDNRAFKIFEGRF